MRQLTSGPHPHPHPPTKPIHAKLLGQAPRNGAQSEEHGQEATNGF